MPEFFQCINWIDILSLILLIRTSYIGFRAGFSVEIFKTLGVFLGLYFGIKYYSDLSALISSRVSFSTEMADGISFLTLTIACILALKFLSILLSKIVKITFADKVDKWAGLVTGFLRGAVLLSLMFMFFGIIQADYFIKSVEERSLTGPYIKNIAPLVYGMISRTSPGNLLIEEPIKAGEKK
ncbi:MAG: CvpA family protein [Candidatus Omnitrophota bacterium]